MKKLIFVLAVIALLFNACKKYQGDVPEIHPVQFKVITSYASADLAKVLPIAKVKLTFKNNKNNKENYYFTKTDGTFSLDSISPGSYDISASIEISATEYSTLTGEIVDKNVIFNASEKARTITIKNDQSINLKLISGPTGPWAIKQIYFAGSNTTTGASFRDQFIEIYNNSDSVLYADSLYIGEALGIQNFTATNIYRQTNSQYDWSKAQGMPTNIDANNDYVYARALLMIPGTGKQYPVKPGTSIILAQTAVNHKAPFTGSDGKTISARDPSLTIDLSGADFEAYYAPFLAKPLASDVDNPLVSNVEVLSYNGTDLILETSGRMGYVIFKNTGSTPIKDLPKYPYPTIAAPSANADKFYQIPRSLIIDAVETQTNVATSRVPKKLVANLDALYTYVPNGIYSSQSVIRKTESTVNGRIILKDTNNSAEDFDYLTLANPRGFK
ncbi:DUF4876 domain-containing protein [Pedobacter frigidisoli]|uniref:DUF4876 domain-containing protein n=1 Tax=Pedobacter frigidisoli TaxID=2530455 RepID=A0A4R0P4Z2_9SPHI|nr:DUF4876 domain-containing protein [Pedobacter frigidisoli]TCD07101.1 DUF4876 domain-containing protein [Pedobacter frigidisoli]